jgi:hypothetical protein
MADSKKCSRCGQTKPVSDFGRNRWAFDDCQYWCKVCMRAYHQERLANPEKLKHHREAAKSWNAENPERYKVNTARWRKANPEKVREQQRRWRKANPDKTREYDRRKREKDPERARYLRRRSYVKRKYGLTVEEYDAAIAKGCAICGSTHRVHMDHDHSNGKVRAALCENCNRAVGLFADEPDRLRAAAKYLEHHRL